MRKILFILIIIIILVPLLLFFFRGTHIPFLYTPSSLPQPTQIPLTSMSQQPFHILSNTPKDNEQNIYPGEITITFSTDQPILSSENVSIAISPSVPHYWKLLSTFPTKTVSAKVYGGLQTSTKYTVSVKNGTGDLIKSWNFTTAATPSADNPGILDQQQESLEKQYYPLLPYIPYNSADFSVVGYNGKLLLLVQAHISDTNTVTQEVDAWIQSKGIDPSTHKIVFQ